MKNLKTLLESYTKEDLKALCKELSIKGYSTLKKAELAEKVAEELLNESAFKERFEGLSTEEKAAFEQAAKVESYEADTTSLKLFSTLASLGYLKLTDNVVEVPEDVVSTYKTLFPVAEANTTATTPVTAEPSVEAPAFKKVGVRTTRKIYPNELCPCGSGKKYKKCCGK